MRRSKRRRSINRITVISLILLLACFLFIVKIFKVKKPEMAFAAIVLDDWGYNKKNVDLLFGIKQPITLAVLPNLPYSKMIAKEARKRGYQVVLHLPLEPRSNKPLEKGTICTWMAKDKIVDLFSKAYEAVPNAEGVSNHMGSKATEDPKVMGTIFEQMKKRNLFFLDNYSTHKTVCKKVSYKCNLKFASRDVFLDNEDDQKKIKRNLSELVKKAKAKGFAVGVGHDKRNTILAIKDFIPEFEKANVKIVKLSELVR